MTEYDRFRAARDLLLAHRTDYAAARDAFRWPTLTTFNWAIDWFDEIARGNDAPALHIVEESGLETKVSYAELSRRSSQVASFLAGLGVKRGDRILLMLGNEVALWETWLAAIKLGAVVIPTTPMLSGPDLADRLERGHVRWVITNGTGLPLLGALLGKAHANIGCILVGPGGRGADGALPASWIDYRDADRASASFVPAEACAITEPLLEYFTSGTTAKPKLVRHSRQSAPAGHLTTMYRLGLQPGDVHWTISSPGWGKHSWGNFFAPFNAQACVFVYNYSRFGAPAILDQLVRHGVQSLCGPPTVWRMLIQEDLKRWKVSLREAVSAGEPLNPEVIERVRAAWGVTIRDGYGQTETTAQVGNSPGQPVKTGSMGRPMPGYTIVLLDTDGKPADEGELCIDLSATSLPVMDGYEDDPAHTAEVMRDGHYHTGDVCTRDADGYITYVGRADDVFKASGYRISPFELESALLKHPAVAEAAVVPSPDPMRGFVPKAFVLLTAGHAPDAATAQSIFAFLRGTVSPYKMIRRIAFSDLPKTISGKIRRTELRTSEAARPATGPRNDREFLEERSR